MWSAPDMERAVELADASGAAGRHVTVAVTDAPGAFPVSGAAATDVMSYITDVLNELGLRAKLQVFPSAEAYFAAINPPIPGQPDSGTIAGTPAHPHAYLTGWISDYPAAANFIDPLFGCEGFYNTGGWCDHQLDARMDAPALHDRTWHGEPCVDGDRPRPRRPRGGAPRHQPSDDARGIAARATCRSTHSGRCCSASCGCADACDSPDVVEARLQPSRT
jgi:hypothetical protein